ncbi:MAG: Fe-S cluster assembly protein SufD [Gammaproteobacteria bacterium]|jgi:Fe-S cluster assembly protein SufD|nr:Fe-S cluster assembly protein SufD [Gammaproteobacteria bacterium]
MSAATLLKEAAARYGREIDNRLALPKEAVPDWLAALRRDAACRFAESGFPTPKAEAWKYTPLQGLLEQEFRAASEDFLALSEGDIEDLLLEGTGHARLVFVNGRFAPHLSRTDVEPGIAVGSLRRALGEPGGGQDEHDVAAGRDAHAFEHMNAALFEDGARIRVASGHRAASPIELLFVSVGLDEPAMHHPRNLLTLEPGAQATIIERYVSLGPSRYFTNAVTGVRLGAGARLEHLRVQEESPVAVHMGGVRVRQAEGSRYAGLGVSLGGAWSRCEHRVDFEGAGAAFELDGLYLAGERQFVDHHVDVRHAVPGCSSRENFKGLLYGAGRAVFDGRIVVEKDAQKTEAALNNANLLLSRNAEVDTKPQLEIYADDVKASHGAAVGQIQPAELFYLRSRGIPEGEAKQMLCLGFAQEVIDACSLPALRERIAGDVARRIGSVTDPAAAGPKGARP